MWVCWFGFGVVIVDCFGVDFAVVFSFVGLRLVLLLGGLFVVWVGVGGGL